MLPRLRRRRRREVVRNPVIDDQPGRNEVGDAALLRHVAVRRELQDAASSLRGKAFIDNDMTLVVRARDCRFRFAYSSSQRDSMTRRDVCRQVQDSGE